MLPYNKNWACSDAIRRDLWLSYSVLKIYFSSASSHEGQIRAAKNTENWFVRRYVFITGKVGAPATAYQKLNSIKPKKVNNF